MSQAEHPDWPNFGDGPAHPQEMGDKFYLPRAAPSRREQWLSHGLILVDGDTRPEDLVRSGLSLEQQERLINAARQFPSSEKFPSTFISLIPLDLAGKLEVEKEEFVLAEEERARRCKISEEEWQEADRIRKQAQEQRDSDPPYPVGLVFAKWDHSDPNHPRLPEGALELRPDIKPEDLTTLALSAEQTERLMGAIGNIFGPHPGGIDGIPCLSPDFAHLDDELKEYGVKFYEELGQLTTHLHEQHEVERKERWKEGIGIDPRLN